MQGRTEPYSTIYLDFFIKKFHDKFSYLRGIFSKIQVNRKMGGTNMKFSIIFSDSSY
jgi:hypothetical protein